VISSGVQNRVVCRLFTVLKLTPTVSKFAKGRRGVHSRVAVFVNKAKKVAFDGENSTEDLAENIHDWSVFEDFTTMIKYTQVLLAVLFLNHLLRWPPRTVIIATGKYLTVLICPVT
jgi:hypothetical protein